MRDWLVIVIAAPLASFGENPGNAQRGTSDHPTHSALVGLAGAALGVERDEEAGQRRLAEAFYTASRTLRPGAPLTDFHTFQSLPSARGAVATRAQALARRGDIQTSITRRDYRCDGLWQAAFTARDHGEIALGALRAAFARPHFPLYAGRKACPLALPVCAEIVEHASIDDAFAQHALRVKIAVAGGSLAIDARIADDGANSRRRHRRNDEPTDRKHWHFSARFEHVRPMVAPLTLTGPANER